MSVHESGGLGALLHGPSLPHGEWWARVGATLVFVVAAGFTLQGAHGMGGGMPMPGGWSLPMMWMVMPGESVWRAAWGFLVMWQAMMVAMMLPSTWPMLALYRRVALFREVPHPVLGTWLVGAGYFRLASIWRRGLRRWLRCLQPSDVFNEDQPARAAGRGCGSDSGGALPIDAT